MSPVVAGYRRNDTSPIPLLSETLESYKLRVASALSSPQLSYHWLLIIRYTLFFYLCFKHVFAGHV